jgi:hypothetical protein
MIIDVELEDWDDSPVVRQQGRDYKRKRAEEFFDEPAQLTARQAVFYRNLIRLAVAVGGPTIPADFELADGRRVYLDRGCMKIAEHAGFVRPLRNGANGVVESIQLAWQC